MTARMRRHAALRQGVLALLVASVAFGVVRAEPLDVKAGRIDSFKAGAEGRRFGQLEFMGGLRLTSSNSLLGALSGIRFRPDGAQFVGVLDTGHWFTGTLVRDASGRISGVRDADISPMRDRRGQPAPGKSEMDAESLAFVPGGIAVSYEQHHRIDLYPDPGYADARPKASVDMVIPFRELRGNRGLETLVRTPFSGPLGGALLTISEESMDDKGNLFAAILGGPLKGRFTVKRSGNYDVTDAAFLPDGDLLVLERRFSLATSIGMRIRRIPGETIRPGALVDGAVLIDADFSYRIDNMEGMDIVSGPGGEPRIIITSDDNHSLFQNTLMLEFRIAK